MSPPAIQLQITGVSADLHVSAATVEERLHAPMRARITLTPVQHGARVTAESLDMIGRDATLTLRFHDVERTFLGQVFEVEDDDGRAIVSIASNEARLDDTRDYRVFVKKSAIDAATEVLKEHQIKLDLRARRTAPVRPQIVQVFETDLAFVARLLAEEGMSFFQKHDDAKTLVIADEPSTFEDLGVTLDLFEQGGMHSGKAALSAKLKKRVVNDKVTLRDYDFTHPQLDLKGETDGPGAREHYEYPGGFETPSAGKDLAAIRLAERRANEVILEALTTAPELSAGGVFTLRGASVDAMNGHWMIVSITHEANADADADGLGYSARLSSRPGEKGHRPPRHQVRRGGAATSTVVGEPGTEIGLADHGQTRVMLRWDRRSTPDHSASEFARVMQPQMAGAIFNPRLGWEELLGFTDDGAEQPIVLGRLYNGAQRPPGSLPADKVETHFGTLTTPKGSQGNFLKINDSAGSEKLSIQASGDYNEQTENDKVVAIKVNHDRTIGGSRKLFVKERFVNNVDGAFTTNVGAFRKVTTDSNYSISAASENIVVAGARTFRVGGDYLTKTPHLMRLVVGKKGEAPIEHHSVFTKGMSTWLVKGGIDTKAALAESVSVAGAAITKVTGPMRVYAPKYQLSVKGIYAENFGHHRARGDGNVAESYRAAKLHMKGASSMDGGDVSIEAKAKLVIKASGVTVTMTPGSIEISGDFEGMTASMEDGNHKYG